MIKLEKVHKYLVKTHKLCHRYCEYQNCEVKVALEIYTLASYMYFHGTSNSAASDINNLNLNLSMSSLSLCIITNTCMYDKFHMIFLQNL